MQLICKSFQIHINVIQYSQIILNSTRFYSILLYSNIFHNYNAYEIYIIKIKKKNVIIFYIKIQK